VEIYSHGTIPVYGLTIFQFFQIERYGYEGFEIPETSSYDWVRYFE